MHSLSISAYLPLHLSVTTSLSLSITHAHTHARTPTHAHAHSWCPGKRRLGRALVAARAISRSACAFGAVGACWAWRRARCCEQPRNRLTLCCKTQQGRSPGHETSSRVQGSICSSCNTRHQQQTGRLQRESALQFGKTSWFVLEALFSVDLRKLFAK